MSNLKDFLKTPATIVKSTFGVTKKELTEIVKKMFVNDVNLFNKKNYTTIIKRNIKNIENKAIKEQKKLDREYKKATKEAELLEKQQKQNIVKQSKYLNTLNNKITNISNGKITEFNVDITKKRVGNIFDFTNKLIELIKKRHINKQLVINVGNLYYTLNENTINTLSNTITGYIVGEYVANEANSDAEFVQYLVDGISNFKIISPDTSLFKPKYAKKQGAFFKYHHNTKYDLTRYQIFNTDNEEVDYSDACLIYALSVGGLSVEKLEQAKYFVKNRNIATCDINTLCEKLNIKINISSFVNNTRKMSYFGVKNSEEYNVCLLDGHYFIDEKTNITMFSLVNYEKVCNIKNFNYLRSFDRIGKDKVISSFNVINYMNQNKERFLKEITIESVERGSTQFYDKIVSESNVLEYDKSCVKEIKHKKEVKVEEYNNYYFDFETYTKKDENNNLVHVPYLCRYKSSKNEEKVFFGEKCGLKMLESLQSNKNENVRLIAHNATYDFRFLIDYLVVKDIIEKGTKLISCYAIFRNMNIEVKDSYNIITMALKNFPKCFGLKNVVKEIMPYDLYNEKGAIEQKWFDINYVIEKYISENDKNQFLDNIKKWNLEIDGKYDIIKYSSEYCKIDCDLLKQGYETCKDWMIKCVDQNIDNVLTISSLADNYLINQGCFDGCYSLSGTPRLFIQSCCVGGRTMIANNTPIIIENEKINDFDGVSLYPSSMNRLEGTLKGKPKVIKNLNYDSIKNYDGYFVEIKIKKIGINRAFSLISSVNDKNVRVFDNDKVGSIIKVDKIALEDLINFQGVEFEILRGYYFDEGRNNKMKSVIKYLFDERLKKKAEKNPMQEVYKLIMNSAYGKTITKEILSETHIFKNKQTFQSFFSKNYNWIQSYVVYGNDKYKVTKLKPLNEHFNRCHVGVEILSMSKRIMNEVMTLAEDNNIDIYYQDTDSMHMKDSDIKTLSELFVKKYNRELVGKNLGQFHSDFGLGDCENVIAKKSIFLGKKCYIDELEGVNKNGETEKGYHIRMKGIPNSCISYTTKKLNLKNEMELYEKLFNGEIIEFDLTEGNKKVNFEYKKNYTVTTSTNFNRNISFRNN